MPAESSWRDRLAVGKIAASLGLTPGLALYIGAIGLVGLGGFAAAAAQITRDHLPALLVMLALAVVAERINLPLPRGGELSPSTMLFMASILLLPAPSAIAVGCLGTLAGQLMARRAWYRLVFNVGQSTITHTASTAFWGLAGGPDVADASMLLTLLPAAFAVIGIYYLLNTTFVCIVLALTQGAHAWHVWWANHYSALLPHVGMQVMGVLFAFAWLADWRAVPLLALPAGVTWRSFRNIRALELTAERERLLRGESEEHAARWSALADVSARLGNTIDPHQVLQITADLAVETCADAACVVTSDGRSASARRQDAPETLLRHVVAAVGEQRPPTDVRVVPLRSGGQIVGTLAVAWRDEGRLESASSLLEPLVDRAAVALYNAILIEQGGEVEAVRELDRLKTEFLAHVGHELNAPLQLVVGYGELLHHSPPGPEQVGWMGERILRAGRHLNRLVEDLTDAARLESGRLSLDRRAVDLRQIVEVAIESAQAANPHQRFTVRVSRQVGPVEADASRVQQVLTNLLSNAARYGPPRGRIRVLIEHADGTVVTAIEDEGTGVPPAERARIFEKFYRAPGADSQSRKGLGLGLAIAHDIVEAHGGEIWVEDAPKGGARFVFTLPEADGALASARP